jgi:hypothetical protein
MMTLVPVVLVALPSAPMSLGGHPGEPAVDRRTLFMHMT